MMTYIISCDGEDVAIFEHDNHVQICLKALQIAYPDDEFQYRRVL